MNKNFSIDETAIKLKDIVLEIEAKASKEISSSKGLSAIQSRGMIDSTAVNNIIDAVNELYGGTDS